MHFRHPELLYALFLLLIPLIVHLFQLRRFQKEDFTNVKLLKKISRQTRKSSRLKKWLVLATRMLLLACVILAFAQPFLPASKKAIQSTQRIIYLDNSLSMQAQGKRGELLPVAIQNLLEELPEDEEFSLITNDEEFLNVEPEEIKRELQEITYSHQQADFNNVQLRAGQVFEAGNSNNKELVMISDFQQNFDLPTAPDGETEYHLIPLRPENNLNVSLDTAFIENRNPENISLTIRFRSNTENDEQVPVSVFNAEELLAKTSVNFEGKTDAETSIQLENKPVPNGRIDIEDNSLQYDNSLYFSFNENPQINVVAVSEAETGFLERIYTAPEFRFESYTPGQTDYSRLSSANLVIVNEVSEISPALSTNLKELDKQGSRILFIPPPSGDISSYNSLLASLGNPTLGDKKQQERLITNIEFSHPLYNAVFEEEVRNFEYPKVQSYYSLRSPGSTVLSLQDNTPFLTQQGQVFLFTASLNTRNSNFTSSPLVVPSFYNIGLGALKTSGIYYEVGTTNEIDIPLNAGKDEIIKIESGEFSFIPLQQNYTHKVRITTGDLPDEAGTYSLIYQDEERGNLSFNFSRKESNLAYQDLSRSKDLKTSSSLEEYFRTSNAASQIHALWKWFVIFALFFLILEMLLLKYLK